MRHTLSGLTGVLLLIPAVGFIAMSARAQEPAASEAKQTAQDAAASEANPIEPAATEALEKMGAYLRSLKSFQVTSEGTSEVVLDDGQKEQFARTANIVARTPDRLMAQISGDQGSKAYFYDGKTFTLFSPDDNYYATIPAPANLRELAEMLDEKYDVEIPLADLFLWGQKDTNPPKITAGMDVGPGEVGGVSCEHYAFRQEGLDWQVWIQEGDFPLPRKLVLTTMTDDARPQHTSVLTWNLAPSYNDGTFVFDPPTGAQKIVFETDATNAKK